VSLKVPLRRGRCGSGFVNNEVKKDGASKGAGTLHFGRSLSSRSGCLSRLIVQRWNVEKSLVCQAGVKRYVRSLRCMKCCQGAYRQRMALNGKTLRLILAGASVSSRKSAKNQYNEKTNYSAHIGTAILFDSIRKYSVYVYSAMKKIHSQQKPPGGASRRVLRPALYQFALIASNRCG
jgi:hypothetical protein